MAGGRDNITVLPPSPLDDDNEQRPLLDEAHPDHGTIDRSVAAQEEEGEADSIDEPTSAKVVVIMVCLWVGSFWAAMGDHLPISVLERQYTNQLSLQTRPSWPLLLLPSVETFTRQLYSLGSLLVI